MNYFRLPQKFVFLAIALLTCFFIACQSTPQRPLRVGTIVWPGYEPLYLARDLGYFDRASIQFVEYSAVTEFARAFQNGAIDIATNTLDRTLSFAEKDPDIRVWLLADVSDGADALVSQSEIKNVQDLEGRTIGLDSSILAKVVLARALQSVDLPIDAVKQVILETTEQEKAFTNKEIDGIVTYEPTRSTLLNQGGNLLFDSRQMPGEIIDVLIGRKELQDTFQKDLKILAEGWFQAIQYIQEHPDDAMQKMAERQGISKEQFIKSLDGLSFVDLQKNQVLLSGENPELYEGAKRLSAFLVEQKLLKQSVNFDTLFDDRFVKYIKP